MRTRLLLVLLSIPVLSAAIAHPAAAQRHRDHGRVYVYRDGGGYRNRIYIPRHRYKEPVLRYRYDDRRYHDQYRYRDDDYRYRDEYRYRNQYRYRDNDRYRYEYRRRGVNIADLILIAAREAAYRDRYYRHRHTRRYPRGVGIYIDL
jgi:hypothetical protein